MPISSVDHYGVRNYHTTFLLMVGVGVTAAVIILFALAVYHFEAGAEGANVSSFGDAVWLMAMAASTIGFGDFYPVTFGGRVVTFAMFALGIGFMGFIGATIAGKLLGWSDTNVKNRELRSQNAAILAKLEILHEKVISISGPDPVSRCHGFCGDGCRSKKVRRLQEQFLEQEQAVQKTCPEACAEEGGEEHHDQQDCRQ